MAEASPCASAATRKLLAATFVPLVDDLEDGAQVFAVERDVMGPPSGDHEHFG
jgi:hypothetical protein